MTDRTILAARNDTGRGAHHGGLFTYALLSGNLCARSWSVGNRILLMREIFEEFRFGERLRLQAYRAFRSLTTQH